MTGGGVRWSRHLGNPLHVCSSYDPAVLFPSIYPRETKRNVRKKSWMRIFIASLSIIAKHWQRLRYLSPGWIDKLLYIYTMEYSAIKSKVLIHGMTWINLENIIERILYGQINLWSRNPNSGDFLLGVRMNRKRASGAFWVIGLLCILSYQWLCGCVRISKLIELHV